MVTITSLASDPPCMKYKSILKKKDFAKNNFEGNSILQKRKFPCPVFDGTGGIEALLYVEENYRKIAKKLGFSGALTFDGWEVRVADSAQDHCGKTSTPLSTKSTRRWTISIL